MESTQRVNVSIRFYSQTANQPHSIDLNIQHSTEWIPWSMIRTKKNIFQIYISRNFNHNFTTTDCSWFTPSFYFRIHTFAVCERFFYSVRNVLSSGMHQSTMFFSRVVAAVLCPNKSVLVFRSICVVCTRVYVRVEPSVPLQLATVFMLACLPGSSSKYTFIHNWMWVLLVLIHLQAYQFTGW